MISENQNKSEILTVEKKKRNYKKKEPKVVETQTETPVEVKVEAVVAKPKPRTLALASACKRPKREKKQLVESPQNNADKEMDYQSVKNLIDTNPSIAEEFQNIIKKHMK